MSAIIDDENLYCKACTNTEENWINDYIEWLAAKQGVSEEHE